MNASRICLLTALVCAGNALAAADPSDPATKVPPIRYESPLRDYRPLGDDKRIPWKAANDEVGRIGGWRAYAKEASEAAAPVKPSTPASASGEVTKPTPPKPATGHEHHGQPK